MPVEVPAAPAAAPTTGLIVSANTTVGDGDWVRSGIVWRPERCISYQTFTPCETLAGVPAESDSGLVYAFPTGFRVRDYCTTMSGDRDAERVRRQAEAATSYIAAQELWTGAMTEAEPATLSGTPYVNPYLADGNATDVTAPTDLTVAVQVLEQAAMQASRGQRVYIHMPISALPLQRDIRRVGNILYTASDNVIVADAGYPGTGAPVAGTSEVQTVTITGGPTGGTFTLTFSGQTTTAIAYNAVGATVGTALNNLSNLDGVVVTGAAGGPYTVTFPVDMGNVPQMTASGAGLTGGTTPAVGVVTATPGVAASTEPGTWIYATGPVQVRLSTVDVIADVDETVDRAINSQEIWADRYFVATFDPCVQFAMNVASE